MKISSSTAALLPFTEKDLKKKESSCFILNRIANFVFSVFNKIKAYCGYCYSPGLLKDEKIDSIYSLGESLLLVKNGGALSTTQKNTALNIIKSSFSNIKLNAQVDLLLKYGHPSREIDPNLKAGLEFVKEFSYRTDTISRSKDLSNLLDRMNTLVDTNIESLSPEIKFSLEEMRIIEHLSKLESLFQKTTTLLTANNISSYAPFFFLHLNEKNPIQQAKQFTEKLWNSVSLDDRCITLFREDSSFKLGVNKKKLWSFIGPILRGSIHLHIALVHQTTPGEKVLNSHITYRTHEKSPLLFNELVGSDFFQLEAKKLVKKEKLERLKEVWACDEDEVFRRVNESLRKEMHKLSSSSESWGKIANTQWKRMACGVGIKYQFNKITEDDCSLEKDQLLHCSEFIAKAIFGSIMRLNEEYKKEVGEDILKDPFSPYSKLSKITPAIFYKEIFPDIATKISPSSLYDKIIV
jgi:hypothetical protein